MLLGVGLVCWALPIWEQLTTSPGNLGELVNFFRQPNPHPPAFRPVVETVTGVVGLFSGHLGNLLNAEPFEWVPTPSWFTWLLVGVLLVVLLGSAIWWWRRHQQGLSVLAATVPVAYVLAVVSGLQIREGLQPYLFAPVLAVSVVAWIAVGTLVGELAWSWRPAIASLAIPGLSVVLVVVALVVGARAFDPLQQSFGDATTAPLGHGIRELCDRGRAVRIVSDTAPWNRASEVGVALLDCGLDVTFSPRYESILGPDRTSGPHRDRIDVRLETPPRHAPRDGRASPAPTPPASTWPISLPPRPAGRAPRSRRSPSTRETPARAHVSAGDEILAECRVGEHASERVGEGGVVTRRHEERGVADNLGQRPRVGGHHGHAGGHGLERRVPEPLVEGGIREHRRARRAARHGRRRTRSPVAPRGSAARAPEIAAASRVGAPAVAARDHESHTRVVARRTRRTRARDRAVPCAVRPCRWPARSGRRRRGRDPCPRRLGWRGSRSPNTTRATRSGGRPKCSRISTATWSLPVCTNAPRSIARHNNGSSCAASGRHSSGECTNARSCTETITGTRAGGAMKLGEWTRSTGPVQCSMVGCAIRAHIGCTARAGSHDVAGCTPGGSRPPRSRRPVRVIA